MADLIAFVTARLDEEHWEAYKFHRDGGWSADMLATLFGRDESDPVIQHIARHDPARVLREVAAKRAILDRHMPHQPAFGGLACNWCSEDVDDRPQIAKESWPCPDVRSLAAVWSDHQDYRQEWAPQPDSGSPDAPEVPSGAAGRTLSLVNAPRN